MVNTNEEKLRQRLDEIIDDVNSDDPKLEKRLKEKGIEYSVIMPIVEVLLGYDALHDIQYELNSTERNDERFDFLLDNCFLIEAKRLSTTLNDINKQIEDYILHNKNINYGMLSNGYEFIFFIQKTFIKSFLTGNQKLKVPIKKDVLPVFSINISNENFFDIMKLFSKDSYKTIFERIAKYIISIYDKGKVHKITGDNDINTYIKELIDKTINIQPGDYLNDINNGIYNSGDKLFWEMENLSITVEIMHDGRVKLNKGYAIIKNMNELLKTEFAPTVDLVTKDWLNRDEIFNNTSDLIKKAMGGRKRLTNPTSYAFKKIT